MKIVFVAKYMDIYRDELEHKLKSEPASGYDELIERINGDHFMMVNSFANYFNKMENTTAHLIIPNWPWLQQKWAQENNCSDVQDPLEIAKIQIKQLQPDILFMNSNFEYYGPFLTEVRPFCKAVFAWISCPIPKENIFQNLDHIVTIFEPHSVYFKSLGIPVTLLSAGFDPEILKKIPKQKKWDVSFIGGVTTLHKERISYLKHLVKKTPIQLWGYGFKSPNPIKNIIKQTLSLFVFMKRYNGPAFGIKMFSILGQSKITFNCHGDLSLGHSMNIRLFEATGCGTLLVTEWSPQISALFEPGKEIVCYRTKDEAATLINYYLKHDEERIKISEAGQKRTLENYTYAVTTAKLRQLFLDQLKTISGERTH